LVFAIPVLDMCTTRDVSGTKMYLDSYLYGNQYSYCSCQLQVVSAAGGAIEIYPYTVDNTNCDTAVHVSGLSYQIGCTTYSNGNKFLFSQDTMEFQIRGEGRGRYCILVQTQASGQWLGLF